jgi:hypothetical protein
MVAARLRLKSSALSAVGNVFGPRCRKGVAHIVFKSRPGVWGCAIGVQTRGAHTAQDIALESFAMYQFLRGVFDLCFDHLAKGIEPKAQV